MSRVPKLRSPVLTGLLPIFTLSLSLMRSFIAPELRSHPGQHPFLVPVLYRINTPYPSCQEPSVTVFTVCYSVYTLSFGQKDYFSVASTESHFPPTMAPSISNKQLKAAVKFKKNYEKSEGDDQRERSISWQCRVFSSSPYRSNFASQAMVSQGRDLSRFLSVQSPSVSTWH